MQLRYSSLSVLFILAVLFSVSGTTCLHAATWQTTNFTVSAHDPKIAQKMAVRAEELRKNMAELWLGESLPNWYKRAEIKIRIGQLAPGGETSFIFSDGEVYGWIMDIQGTEERVYDSVLPHEITHMILASHFRRPVPRWADEGAATFTESIAERRKYQKMLIDFLTGQKGIPMDRLFGLQDYPKDKEYILPLYAQGYSVSEFLIRQRGPKYFTYFIQKSMERETGWNELIYECYGYETLQELQNDWVTWVGEGSPEFLGSNLIAGDQMNNGTAPGETVSPTGVILASAVIPADNSSRDNQVRPAVSVQPRSVPATYQGQNLAAVRDPAVVRKPYSDAEPIRWQSSGIHPE